MSEKAKNPYKILTEICTGEYEEKKSKFIAHLAFADSEEMANAYIASIKKKYYDARHNCSALIIGEDSSLVRSSDDGEPSGTAGKPMLEVLLGSGLTNVVAVVTRYFGGTLLGTGGLVRAYTAAVKDALNDALTNSKIASMEYCSNLDIICSYSDINNIQYYFSNNNIMVIGSDYLENVIFHIRTQKENEEATLKTVTELTKGQAKIEIIDTGFYPIH